jgi:hypothetical protein
MYYEMDNHATKHSKSIEDIPISCVPFIKRIYLCIKFIQSKFIFDLCFKKSTVDDRSPSYSKDILKEQKVIYAQISILSFMRGRYVQVSLPGEPFEIVERDVPEPGASQVHIKVQACGICHGDALIKERILESL